MKTMYSLFIAPLLALFFVSNNIERAESNPTTTVKQTTVNSFSFFRTHKQGRGAVTSTWGMNASNGITCFILERTYEDPNDPYSVWDCVCNQPCTGIRSYRFTDNNVSPGFITYRVTAQLQGGGTIVSEFSTEHIVSH